MEETKEQAVEKSSFSLLHGDCLDHLRQMPDDCVDLVFCSPPYEAARTYGIDFKLRGEQYVEWAVARFVECTRVSKGLVAWVIEGQTRDFRWSASPAMLMADLHRRGVRLRKPPVFHRVGIPGSGGPDWLRNDYEFIVCSSKGKLPWSDNTAMGHPPKWGPGGEMSHRVSDGTRRNQWGAIGSKNGMGAKDKNGNPRRTDRPSHVIAIKRAKLNSDRGGGESTDGVYEWNYVPPVKANPGNVIKRHVGGGAMGSKLAHENEAPFPESLAEFFVRSFCPPGGWVLDPFCGSGTTIAVALKHGRSGIGIDVRESQIALTQRRLGQ